MVDAGELSSSAAKDVLIAAIDGEGAPRDIALERDLMQMTDVGAIEEAVDAVLEANSDAVAKIRAGDMKPMGYLIGQVMRTSGGKADPTVVQRLVRDKTSS